MKQYNRQAFLYDIQNKRVATLFFYRRNCKACSQAEPIIELVADTLNVYSLQIADDIELAKKFQITSSPSLLVFKESPERYTGTDEIAKYINQLANQSRGLGDTIEKITTATGIKKIVKKVVGEDCGCDERRDKLNEMFPYKKS